MRSGAVRPLLLALALAAALGAAFLPLAGSAAAASAVRPPAAPSPARHEPAAHASISAGGIGKGVVRWLGESVAGFVGFGIVNSAFEGLVGAIFGKAESDSEKLDDIRDKLKAVEANIEDLKKRLGQTEDNLGAQIAAVDYRLYKGQIGERIKSLETFLRLLASAAAIGAEPGGTTTPQFARTAAELREIVLNLNRHGADIVTDRVLGIGSAHGEGLLTLWSDVVTRRAKAEQGGLFTKRNSAQINLQYHALTYYLLVEQLARALYERDRLGFSTGTPGAASAGELRSFGRTVQENLDRLGRLEVEPIPDDQVLDLRSDRVWFGNPARDKVEFSLGGPADPLGAGDHNPLAVYRRASGLTRAAAESALTRPGGAANLDPATWRVATADRIEELKRDIGSGKDFARSLYDRTGGGQEGLFGALDGGQAFFTAPLSVATDRKDLYSFWCQSTLYCKGWLGTQGLGDKYAKWWHFPDLDANGYADTLHKSVDEGLYKYLVGYRKHSKDVRWTAVRWGIGSRAIGVAGGEREPTYAFRIAVGPQAPGVEKAAVHLDGSHFPWPAGTATKVLGEGLVDRQVAKTRQLSDVRRRGGYLMLEKPYGYAGGPRYYLR